MNSKRQTTKTMTTSLIAASLLTFASAVTLTSAANALTSPVDGIHSAPTIVATSQTGQWQMAEAQDSSKKKKKKKKRHGSFHGG